MSSTTTPTVHVQPITDASPYKINCPCCGKPRLIVTEAGMENAGGSMYFLEDGDTIQGIWSNLRPEQQKRETYTAVLEVGTCSACGGRYFIVDVALVDSLAPEGSKDYDFHLECLHGNIPLRLNVQAVCSLDQPIDGVPAQWLMLENLADDKPIQQHWFGPFRLDNPDDVEGANGVAYHGGNGEPWAFGKDLVLKVWDALWALNFERTPENARDKDGQVYRTLPLERMLELIGNGIEKERDQVILGLLDKAWHDLLESENVTNERMYTEARGAALTVLGPGSASTAMGPVGPVFDDLDEALDNL